MLSPELKFLYGLYREGIKLNLSVTREFSSRLGSPENDFRSFHVAGTNGKGSTSAYIYNILGIKHSSGLYTSPHLIDFNERIIANREPISDQEIENFIYEYRDLITELGKENRNPTFFESTTVMAFKHFQQKKMEFASIEVGLGGRLDSTNIIKPEVSVITQVGYEHADKLGCSLTSISTEKAGIVKEGIPVVLGDSKKEVVDTVRKIAQWRNSPFVHTPSSVTVSDYEQSIEGSRFTLSTPKEEYKIETSMIGEFQTSNIATSVLAIENSQVSDLSRVDIEKGIRNTRWPGRMDIVSRDPVVMVDGAHNPPAANALRIALQELGVNKPTLILGMLSDKDAFSFLRIMRSISDTAIFTSPDEPSRAIPPEKLQVMSNGIFKKSKVIQDPIEAYESAAKDSEFILVAGSLYLAGVIMKHLKAPVMPYGKL